jgi:poly-gamma-glutamate capsule biosynthesis protein CapA/YwtB (metallophosphatase superfamily)
MPALRLLLWMALFVFGIVAPSYFVPYVEDIRLFSFDHTPDRIPFKEGTILFGGDIMLGRSVERIAKENDGYGFHFQYIKDAVEKSDLAIANFESSVPAIHMPTPSLGMKFSVPFEALVAVKDAGFDIVSLSNNHSFDYGEKGYVETRASCVRAGISCIGHSFKHGTSSIAVEAVGDTRIGILALHTLFAEPSTTTLNFLIHELKGQSDIQFVFIHWGEEYKPLHNGAQEKLAHFLIDEGIDAVVGHHPHVTEDIELYKGKPIFYSLGNLIFDQFFSDEVQEGFMIEVNVGEDAVEYVLLPYELKTERTQPQFESGDLKSKRLGSLMPYAFFSIKEIEKGSFSILRD